MFFVECNGREIPGSEGSTEAQIGCRVHFDVTPKDAQNAAHAGARDPALDLLPGQHRRRRGEQDAVHADHLRDRRRHLTAYCEADGVRSNDVRITFHN